MSARLARDGPPVGGPSQLPMSVLCPYCQTPRAELSLIELAQNRLLCCGEKVAPETLAKMVIALRISERNAREK